VSSPLVEPEYCSQCIVGMTFDMPEAPSCVTYLRKKARAMIESLDVSHQDADDLELILGELATNAVLHAKGGEYHVSIEVNGDQATILVADNGVGFSPDTLPPPGTTRPNPLSEDASDRIGGFGLPLVRHIADNVDITPNASRGMTIRVAKKLLPRC